MQNKENTKTRKTKKSNDMVKRLNHIIGQAKKGSKEHIAVLVGIALAVILVIAVAVWGVTSLVGGDAAVDPDGDISAEIDPEADNKYNKDDLALDTDKLKETILPETADAGDDYIKETVFIGDSNTVRTMMYGHTTWTNVVGATSMGIQHVTTKPISFFEGMQDPVDVATSIKIMQPKRVVITYGTNNTIGWSAEKFVETYEKAIQAIVDAYPYCDIIVNAVPPIDRQRENLAITMQTIDSFNKALAEMCDKKGYKFLNSAEVLKDSATGFAKTDYTIGDGVHLSQKGMDALFEYIKTHSFITEDRRPKLTYIPKRLETPTGIIGSDPIAVRGGRVSVSFVSNDYELGGVEGEAEQSVKRTLASSQVTAVPKTENGGVFIGWSSSYEGISNKEAEGITYTVPQLTEDITSVTLVANFKKVGLTMNKSNLSLDKGSKGSLSASITESNFKGDKTITWSSSNPDVAKVDASGNVTGVSNGSASIKASILGGKIETSCSVSVVSTLQKIDITQKDGKKEMATKTTMQLSVTPTPAGTAVATPKWTSSDEAIATVNAAGLVTAKDKNGTVTIKAQVGGLSAEYTITVKGPKPVTSLSVSASATKMPVGSTSQLTVSYTPNDTTDPKSVSYTSNNTGILTVNSSGLVTGVSAGTARVDIKFTGVSGSTISTYIDIEITAKPVDIPPTGISISGSQEVEIGKSITLTVNVTPENATNKTVTWLSSNTSVASVSAGTVTGIATGTVDITATTVNGKSYKLTITVKAAATPTPTCPTCGSTDHTVHPVDPPKCPVCGATDHTEHPVDPQPDPTCTLCASTEHKTETHPCSVCAQPGHEGSCPAPPEGTS